MQYEDLSHQGTYGLVQDTAVLGEYLRYDVPEFHV